MKPEITYFFSPEKHLVIESRIHDGLSERGVLEWQVAYINGLRSTIFGSLDESDEARLDEFYESGNLGELARVF